MNAEIKKKWVAALRSGKYKQGKGTLRKADQYCCLGVLCDIYAKQHNRKWEQSQLFEGDEYYQIHGCSNGLPFIVNDWAALDENYKERPTNSSHLIVMNDDQRKNFNQIADFIEKEL